MTKAEGQVARGDKELGNELTDKARDFVFVIASAALEDDRYDMETIREMAEKEGVLEQLGGIVDCLIGLEVLPKPEKDE